MNIEIKNAKILSPSRIKEFYKTDHCIYIADGKIAAIDTPPQSFYADKTIDASNMLVTPGLINSHTHAYMSVLRNYADDLPFETWLFKRVMPVEDSMSWDDGYWGSLLACMEMIKGGVTSYLDMHMFPGASIKAATESGMRAVVSRGLTGGGDDKEGGERRIREALSEMDEYKNAPGIGFMLAPHAPYSCDEGFLKEIAALSKEKGLGIHTHLCESKGEIQGVLESKGMTPIEYFDKCGLFDGHAVAAHCVHLTDREIDILAEKGVHVALNPASNLKLANGIAPVPKLQEKGVRLCLGTDSAASNNNLSILREMGLTSLLHKGITGDPCAVSAWDTFLMATKNGASALQLSNTGEIEPGYNADLALFALNTPALKPLGDPAAALCYAGAGLSASTVIIGGRVVLDNGVFTTLDEDKIYAEIDTQAKRLGVTE